MTSIGERLKKARDKKGLTQKEVFERTGITDKSLSRYENNKAEPDADALLKLSALYEVSIDWILGKENKKESDQMLPDNEFERIVRELETEQNINLHNNPIAHQAVRQALELIIKAMKSS